MSKIPLILDGDPGHDDAIAWMLCRASDELSIRAVTTESGNQTIEKTTYNARRVCTLLGIDAPVAMGAPRPLYAAPVTAGNIHGTSGLDGPALPEPVMDTVDMAGWELMAKVLTESREPVTILATGALTNVALLLQNRPELKEKIGRISLMGGGLSHGNWTPAAEFNILIDAEAADIVFRSGIPLLMSGLDVTERALVLPEDFEAIRRVGNPVARTVADWLDFFFRFHREIGYTGAPLHDPVAVVALLHPEILTMKELYVEIETGGKWCRGATVGDFGGIGGKAPNVTAALDIDRAAFVRLLTEAAAFYA